MPHALLTVVLLLLCSLPLAQAQQPDPRFQQALLLTNGQRVVVAEGEFEPRSVGSYSVRLYGARNADFPYDDFLAGVVLPRDGAIEALQAVPLPTAAAETPDACFAVIQRSVGSAGFGSGELLCAEHDAFALRAHVSALPPHDDVLSALLQRFSR